MGTGGPVTHWLACSWEPGEGPLWAFPVTMQRSSSRGQGSQAGPRSGWGAPLLGKPPACPPSKQAWGGLGSLHLLHAPQVSRGGTDTAKCRYQVYLYLNLNLHLISPHP